MHRLKRWINEEVSFYKEETMFFSIPSKKLTDKDREEIIAILESFRDTP